MTRKPTSSRSWPTTIVAALISLGTLAVAILIWPITSFSEGTTFGVTILLFIVSTLVTIEGKKGSLTDLIYSLGFWR